MQESMFGKKIAAFGGMLLALSVSAADFWEISGRDDWKRYGEVSIEKAHPYGGGFKKDGDGIIVENRDASKAAGAGWGVELDQKRPAAIRFSAEVLVLEEVKGSGLQLFADITYADGSVLQAQTVKFAKSPGFGWQSRTYELIPRKPLKSLHVYTMLYRSVGKVRFRNVRLEELAHGRDICRLDKVIVKRRAPPEKSGLYIRDAALDDGFAPVEGAETKGILISQKVERKGAARFFDLELSAADKTRDRAVTVIFAVPVTGEGGVWHEDPRTDVKMVDGIEYFSASQVPCGVGLLTKWPLGAVSAAGRSIAIGIDPEWTAIYRVGANPAMKVLYIAFDLGFAPEHNHARVKFAVFPFEHGKGMRGALAAYDKIYPMAFERRIPQVGVWQVTTPISSIADHEDFGFKFMEGGGTWKWDDEHDIYTFKYTEPGSWWMNCPGKDGNLPTLRDCIETAKGWLNQTTNMRMHVRAKVWSTSVAKDEAGQPVGEIQIAPWTRGIMWCMNSAPGINGGDNDYWTKNSEKDFAERYKDEFPKGVDGEYIDSSEMCFHFGCDYDRSHFAGMETPLTFGKNNKRVCIAGGMASYEYVRKTARRLRERGRYVQANSTPRRTSMLMPWIDAPGTELKWYRAGKWFPDSDETMLYRRAISGRRPFCFLQNTEFDEFHGYVERYMQRALAYGMICGFFSSNGYTDCYFSKRERYEKDRHLFKKYIPLQRELADVGWTPVVTLAESSNPEVYVEQFGKRYVTVFNGSLKEAKTAKIGSPRAGALERVTGEKWDFSKGPKEIVLPPETVRMLDFGE